MYTVAWESFVGMQRAYFDTRETAVEFFQSLESIGRRPYFYED